MGIYYSRRPPSNNRFMFAGVLLLYVSRKSYCSSDIVSEGLSCCSTTLWLISRDECVQNRRIMRNQSNFWSSPRANREMQKDTTSRQPNTNSSGFTDSTV